MTLSIDPNAPINCAPPTAREEVLAAMQARPDDPWPRGQGHVILAFPGSREEEKSYHEPGGSFSPVAGSFGVSIWVSDEDGALIATSDSISPENIAQELGWQGDEPLPAIQTQTPWYRALWSRPDSNRWKLQLEALHGARLQVSVRGVGPAAGPLCALRREGYNLQIGRRWGLEVAPDAPLFLGHESEAGWKDSTSERQSVEDAQGWACARWEVKGQLTLEIRDSAPYSPCVLANTTRAPLELDLPDPRFPECLQAQVAHLMMGLVRDETRPGDPLNYPVNWQRDGAYVIVALARAGLLEAAQTLLKPVAEHDFFGGFGSEADAPGLALWALDEVASRLPPKERAAFERAMWPHLFRKCEIVIEMLETRRVMRVPALGPIVPRHSARDDLDWVCEPSQNGLINGRMDWGRPMLYISAVAFRGLCGGAIWAKNRGDEEAATRWHETALGLQSAWGEGLRTDLNKNERTAISGLWPSDIAAPFREAFDFYLDEKHSGKNSPLPVPGAAPFRPLWTYFRVAKAHQWLRLGNIERVWQTLEWFWNNQESPGLWTWWESNKEENFYGLWQHVRGWVAPQSVTPHYWTAAELLAFQLAMLTDTDLTGDKPVLVIGAGVPPTWLSHSLRVAGVPTPLGNVEWTWKNNTLSVRVQGATDGYEVRPGAAFPTGLKLEIDTL